MIALVVVVAALAGQVDSKLVGSWGMGGHPFATFKANGTGTMEGEPFKWKAKGGTLTITADGETERIAYEHSGADHITLTMGGIPLGLDRIKGSGASAAPAPKQKLPDEDEEELDEDDDAPPPRAAKAPVVPAASKKAAPVASSKQDKQIAAALTRNAWCSFSFKGGSTYTGGSWGSSSQSRVVFSPDGTVTRSSGGESSNSGSAGAYASQGSGGDSGFWKVKGGQLMLSEDGQTWGVQPVEAHLNSSGSPILKSGGVEYMVCN